MEVKIVEVLRELQLRKPASAGCTHIIWVYESENCHLSIDFNRPWDSIHGQCNDEVGYYLSDEKLYRLF